MYRIILFYLLILILAYLICYRSMPRYSILKSLAKGGIKIKAKAKANATTKYKKKDRKRRKKRKGLSPSHTAGIPRTRAGGQCFTPRTTWMKGCVLEIIIMRGPRIMWGRETFVCRGVAHRGYWILLSPSKSFGGEQRHKGMWTNPATAPARAPMQDHRCAAGEHCLMKMTPLPLVNGHMCLNCNRQSGRRKWVVTLCCSNWNTKQSCHYGWTVLQTTKEGQ